MRVTLLAAGCLAALVLAAQTSAAADPRKCDNKPVVCSKTAAVIALQRHMATLTGASYWTNQIRCTSNPTMLTWTCVFGVNAGLGRATIAFRALSNGWHTRVVVVCNDSAFTAATSCHE